MGTKHTPGPWTVEVGPQTTSVESKYETIASDVANCNADLIAAAPDLFAALKAVVARIDAMRALPMSLGGGCLDHAHTAIAKAEGEGGEEAAKKRRHVTKN